jgi:NADH-quinone oxidoreductase subunit J
MVLFLFVIMLLGADRLSHRETLPWQRPLAIILGVILFLEAAYMFFFRSGLIPQSESVAEGFGGPQMVGEVLFDQFLLPFEVTSVLLLVAIVGAIVLTQRRT